jgi:hypothetical protein
VNGYGWDYRIRSFELSALILFQFIPEEDGSFPLRHLSKCDALPDFVPESKFPTLIELMYR